MTSDLMYYFFERKKHRDEPAGWTVSKTEKLPEGEFSITEYSWGPISLWFIDDHNFTAHEREAAKKAFITLIST